jgi:hypothetical protein
MNTRALCSPYLVCALLAVPMGIPLDVSAADPEFALVIRNHRFEPAELRVPAGKKVKIVIDNQDTSAEEFESHELNREKVVPGKSKVPVYIGPLAPGRYPFIGEFNQKTAKGVVVAE